MLATSHLALGKLRVTTSTQAIWIRFRGVPKIFLLFQACRNYIHLSVGSSYFHLMTLPYRKFAAVKSFHLTPMSPTFEIHQPTLILHWLEYLINSNVLYLLFLMTLIIKMLNNIIAIVDDHSFVLASLLVQLIWKIKTCFFLIIFNDIFYKSVSVTISPAAKMVVGNDNI